MRHPFPLYWPEPSSTRIAHEASLTLRDAFNGWDYAGVG